MTRVYRGLMWRLVVPVLAAILIWPLAVDAQETAGAQETSPPQGAAPLELTRETAPPRLNVHPAPPRDEAAAEAERATAEHERARRAAELARELTRPAPRPDLGYDVTSGIQRRNIMRAPLR